MGVWRERSLQYGCSDSTPSNGEHDQFTTTPSHPHARPHNTSHPNISHPHAPAAPGNCFSSRVAKGRKAAPTGPPGYLMHTIHISLSLLLFLSIYFSSPPPPLADLLRLERPSGVSLRSHSFSDMDCSGDMATLATLRRLCLGLSSSSSSSSYL